MSTLHWLFDRFCAGCAAIGTAIGVLGYLLLMLLWLAAAGVALLLVLKIAAWALS